MKRRMAGHAAIVWAAAALLAGRSDGQPVGMRQPVSPQVNPDRTVVFRLAAPAAGKVQLDAQFEKGPVDMTRDTAGVWSVTVGPVEPDLYPYHFDVDGMQVADPRNQFIFPNEGFQNSLVEIPGDPPPIHSILNIPHGTLAFRTYFSDALGVRPVLVYTPPGYEENRGRKYPALYLLHGTTDTEETWTKVGRANFILDNLIHQGKAVPMIVVMPYGRAYPVIPKSAGSLRSPENLQEFQKDFFGCLLPFVEGNYRVLRRPDGRAIAGFSGGGGEALYLGLNHPDLFAWVCGFAPGMRKEEFDRNNSVLFADPDAANRRLKLFWIGIGREDGLFPVVSEYLRVLDEKKIRHETFLSDGGHTWMNCRLYLSTIARRLFQEPDRPRNNRP
ncbi:MAG: alpha/beta hydrolase-fold protein [bacterium]|nr:alpha/beta hydrolase-fold protein [bacterium]